MNYFKEESEILKKKVELINKQEETFFQKYNESQKYYYMPGVGRDKQIEYQIFGDENKRKFEQITSILDSPYEGRVDIQRNDKVENCYIGSIPYYVGGVLGDVNPTHANKIIYDWRSNVGGAFRRRDKAYNCGKILLNNTIIINKGELKTVFNQFDIRNNFKKINSTVMPSDLIKNKSETDAIIINSTSDLIELNKERKSILSTLSKNQNQMIDFTNTNMIIQGVPGSGKTVVGGYRLSKMVYDKIIDKNEDFRAYFVTSNDALLKHNQPYFSKVDLSNIRFRVLDNLILRAGEPFIEKKNIPEKVTRSKKVFNILNNLQFKQILDEMLEEKNDYDYFMASLKARYYFTNEENIYVKYLLQLYYLLNDISSSKQSKVIESIRNTLKFDEFEYRLLNRQKDDPDSSDIDRLSIAIDKIHRSGNGRVKVQFKTSMGVIITSSDEYLIQNIKKAYDEERVPFFEIEKYTQLLSLYRKLYSLKTRRYKNAIKSREYDTKGSKVVNEEIKHILLDEAQDYSLFEIIVLKNLYPEANWTICGDINQSNGDASVMNDWVDLESEFDCNVMVLNTCFRSSNKVVRLMNHYTYNEKYGLANSPEGHIGFGDVLTIKENDSSNIKNFIKLLKSFKKENTCLIYIKESTRKLLEGHSLLKDFDMKIAKSVKGMEFKNVVIFDTKILKEEVSDQKFKYMLISRALNNLVSVENTEDFINYVPKNDVDDLNIF